MVSKIWALVLMMLMMAWCAAGSVRAAGELQFCKFNSNCVVGEFLYDDNYSPINVGATCTLTSRDPSGNVFTDSQLMPASGKNDGWYSYAVGVGETEGTYPTQMCCTVPADVGTTQYMCLDKSFRVGQAQLGTTEVANAVWDSKTADHNNAGSFGKNNQNPTLTANDFWSFSNRTLSSFGSLVDDIWSYTNRSLTSFGTLIADIWSNNTVNTLATKLDVSNVGSSLATSTNNIRGDIANVGTSLATIEQKINVLDTKVTSIGSTLGTILNKWGSYSVGDILTSINGVAVGLGNSGDSCSVNSVFGNIACVKDKWGSQTAQSLYDMASNTLNVGNSLRAELNYNGKSTTAYEDMQTIKSYVDGLEASIGTTTDLSSAGTLFGKIKGNKEDIATVKTVADTTEAKIDSLDTKINNVGTTLSTLMAKWGSYSVSDIISGVTTVQTRIGTNGDGCAINTIFGNIACVKDKWGSQTAEALYTAANNAYNTASSLRSELNYNGKSTTAYEDMQSIKDYVDSLETSLGTVGSNVAAIKTTVDSIETKVNSLDTKVSSIGTSVAALLTKWGSYTVGDMLTSINNIGSSLGTGSDTCASNTVFGNIACVKDKWGSQTAEALYTAANNAFTTVTSLRAELDYNGKSSTAYADLQSVKNYVDSLEASIGNSSDLSSASTLFGKIRGNKDDVASAVTSIKGTSNKDLSVLSGEVAGVKTVADSIQTKVDGLSSGIATIDTNIDTLITKWGSYAISDVVSSINSVRNGIGVSGDTCSDTATLFGGIDCLRSNGSSGDNSTVIAAVNNVSSLVTELTNELSYNGKSTTAYNDVQAIKTNLGVMLAAVGNSTDDANTATVFGRIKKIQSRVDALNTTGAEATTIIDKWGSLSASDIYEKVKDLSSQISNINTVNNVSSILTVSQSSANDLQSLKNQILAMKALVNVNKTLLEKTTTKPVIKTWLEEGSIIFKTMLTNPGDSRQTVPLKFYLPREADKKNIIKIDAGLDVIYDSNESAYYVSGEFDLKPNETRIVAIEVEDVWKVSESQIESLRMQVEELSKPLKNTAYFAQGVTLKSDITVQLDNILRTQKDAITPDSRIKTYRENADQLKRVQTEIGDLKGLVTQASSNGSLMGFVGGSQTISLWGIVIVLIVGIALLTVYMRTAINQLQKKKVKKGKTFHWPKINLYINRHVIHIGALVIMTVVPTFTGTWMILDKVFGKTPTKKELAVVKVVPTVTPSVAVVPTAKPVVMGVKVEKIKIAIPEGSTSIKVRILPDAESTILARLWSARKVDKYSEKDEWIEISTNITIDGKSQLVRGWIRKLCQVE